MTTLKELAARPERLSGGHRLCAGCGASIVIRQLLAAVDNPMVVGCATGCLEVATTIYPYTAWRTSYIHSAFENVAATISGVEAAYKALRRRGAVAEDFRFIAIGGDGGTYDIGFQALSGAMERGHRMLYLCYDNQAYMNTGIQRSSATPLGAETTTSPVGSVLPGKSRPRKDLTAIIAAHDVPYVAQAAPHRWRDLVTKGKRALDTDGASFMNVLAPCPRGWRFDPAKTIEILTLAVDTCFWPLFEVSEGRWTLSYRPKEKVPVAEFLKVQGRFRHLFKQQNREVLAAAQAEVDRKWEALLRRVEG
ncbi:MAG: thiamine pyrophosphate-dependent enzyme [bacterium]|nr:thiamine pyrophosphate-dependent enzyme [bacterium]